MITPPTQEELDDCPFCAGREDRTPPETLRVGDPWTVRVVPNLYPALDRQEVVIHSPRHVRSFADLADAELEATSLAWHRLATAAADTEYTYLHCLINEGRAAGSSLPHSHSQVVYLREAPPAAAVEHHGPGCPVCRLVKGAPPELVIGEDNGAVAIAHPAGRLPYEVLIAGPHPDLDLTAAFRLIRHCVRRLHEVEGAVPWNAWLHNAWQGLRTPELHPHVELVPRLSALAGLELGAGIYVNTVAPEAAAKALRD